MFVLTIRFSSFVFYSCIKAPSIPDLLEKIEALIWIRAHCFQNFKDVSLFFISLDFFTGKQFTGNMQ